MGHFSLHFFVLGVVARLTDTKVTVTTTIPAVQTSARPTTLLRIIAVREEDYHVKNNTDIFETTKSRARRSFKHLTELWKWDHWCMLQPKTGNCGPKVTKYYYNSQINQCMPHPFTGCKTKGNNNQFDSIESCENYCKGASLMPKSTANSDDEDTNSCELQPISGQCLGYNTMFYYDVNAAACKTFIYGGCAGNKNKFYRRDDCMAQCANAARILKKTSEEASSFDDNTS